MERFEALLGVNPWTALFILLNTLTIFFVAKKFLFKPVMDLIAQRQKEIDDLYADADSAKASAQAMESEYKLKLSAASETSERLVKEAVARGQSREEEILRQANAEANAIMEKAAAAGPPGTAACSGTIWSNSSSRRKSGSRSSPGA